MIREHNGKKLRYREYPWGIVEVENLDHNDFIPLRDMVVRTNLIDMIDVTRNVHYENFRFRQMEKLPKHSGDRYVFYIQHLIRNNLFSYLTVSTNNSYL